MKQKAAADGVVALNPHGFYILNAEGKADPCPDGADWLAWYQATAKDREIARTEVKDHLVLTTFTGLDYGIAFGARKPILWQVVVFTEKGVEVWSARYRGRKHAQRTHKRLVEALEKKKKLEGIER